MSKSTYQNRASKEAQMRANDRWAQRKGFLNHADYKRLLRAARLPVLALLTMPWKGKDREPA